MENAVQLSAASFLSAIVLSPTATLADAADCETPAIAWRVAMPGPTLHHRPAIGPSGELAVQTSELAVIEPDGLVRWRKPLPIGLPDSICDIDAMGRVYANSSAGLRAFSSDGSDLWTLPAVGSVYQNHAGPSVGPDGNIYFVDFSFNGFGFGSVTPAGQLRWSLPGFGDADQSQRKIEVVFVDQLAIVSAPQTPFDCDGGCLSSGVVARELDGSPAWKANTTTPRQPTFTASGDVLVPVAPSGVARIDINVGSAVFVPLNSEPNTGPIVTPSPLGSAYAVTRFSAIQQIEPNGSVSELASPGAIMGSPAVSPDGTLLVVGTADSLLPSPNFITGIDTQTGDVIWSIPLPIEDGWQLTATGWPRFSPDGQAVYVGVNAGPNSYLYAVDLCPEAACVADLNGDGLADFFDVQAYLGLFDIEDPAADLNGDGLFDFFDVQIFLNRFASGCP